MKNKNKNNKNSEKAAVQGPAEAVLPETSGKPQQLHSSELDLPSRLLPSDKRFGREIAFGIQQTLTCFATDFFDPWIGKLYQNKFGNKEHEVTNAHTWFGEIVGDLSALGVYLAAKRFFSKPIDGLIATVKNTFDGRLTKMGKRSLESWRQEHHLTEDDPRYKRKLENYKEFQAENLVDTTIVAASSTIINVGAQRAVGNKQAYGLILVSKLIGAAATMGGMLGLRTLLPQSTHMLDKELSDRYFSKAVRGTKRAFGVKNDEGPIAEAKPVASQANPAEVERDAGFTERLTKEKQKHEEAQHQLAI